MSENSRPSTEADVKHLARLVRQWLRQPLDEFTDAARNVEPNGPGRRAAGELPVRRHLAKHLVQEERIAFGRVAQEVDERARRPHAPGALDELADVGFAKPPQGQHQTLALGLGEERGKLRQVLDLDLAVGADDRRPHGADLPRHGDEHHDRGRIGGVQIVEDDEQRLRLGRPPHERGDRIEQAKPGLFGLRQRGARRLRQAAEPLAKFRRDLRDLGCVVREPAREGSGIGVRDQTPQGLHPGPVRRRASVLPAAAPQRPHASLVGVSRRLSREPALAHAWLARKHQQAPFGRQRAVDARGELGKLMHAIDEGFPIAIGPLFAHAQSTPPAVRHVDKF